MITIATRCFQRYTDEQCKRKREEAAAASALLRSRSSHKPQRRHRTSASPRQRHADASAGDASPPPAPAQCDLRVATEADNKEEADLRTEKPLVSWTGTEEGKESDGAAQLSAGEPTPSAGKASKSAAEQRRSKKGKGKKGNKCVYEDPPPPASYGAGNLRSTGQWSSLPSPSATAAGLFEDGSYEAECRRIHRALEIKKSSQVSPVLPPFYLRHSHPLSDELLRHLRQTTKSFQLTMGVVDVETLDDMHLMLRRKMASCGQTAIDLKTFLKIAARTQRAVLLQRQRRAEKLAKQKANGETPGDTSEARSHTNSNPSASATSSSSSASSRVSTGSPKRTHRHHHQKGGPSRKTDEKCEVDRFERSDVDNVLRDEDESSHSSEDELPSGPGAKYQVRGQSNGGPRRQRLHHQLSSSDEDSSSSDDFSSASTTTSSSGEEDSEASSSSSSSPSRSIRTSCSPRISPPVSSAPGDMPLSCSVEVPGGDGLEGPVHLQQADGDDEVLLREVRQRRRTAETLASLHSSNGSFSRSKLRERKKDEEDDDELEEEEASDDNDGLELSLSTGDVVAAPLLPTTATTALCTGGGPYLAPLPPPQQLEKPLDPLYVRDVVPYPRLSAHLFLASARTREEKQLVPVQSLCQNYALAVSRVKSEVELRMWDANSDGRLSEDEMENYVREMVPHMEALREVAETILPFYCCTVSRRIFWDLDTANRSTISIDALLQSDVLSEWLRLQLLPDDNPRSWFSDMVTYILYDKFLLLDTRNEGTLRAEDLKRYKKGLPSVVNDGLPPDVSPLSSLFVDRYFETTVMMAHSEMDFRKFVDFVIAIEMLPQCSRPLFFWNILDMDGAGVLTPMTVNSFFRETHAKVESNVSAAPSRETVVQELFDIMAPEEPLLITREEFVNSPQAGLFTAIMVDCLSFWGYENRSSK